MGTIWCVVGFFLDGVSFFPSWLVGWLVYSPPPPIRTYTNHRQLQGKDTFTGQNTALLSKVDPVEDLQRCVVMPF